MKMAKSTDVPNVSKLEGTPHTFSNDSDEVVRSLVIKRMPTDENYVEILKNDKVLD